MDYERRGKEKRENVRREENEEMKKRGMKWNRKEERINNIIAIPKK